MTRKFGYILAAVAVLLALAACGSQSPAPTEPDHPTLPTIPQSQTPAQLLAAAIAGTEAAEAYDIRYGYRTAEDQEQAHTQSVSSQHPLDREALTQALPELPDRDDFLEQFCNRSLWAIPSNTGSIRYQLGDLTWEDARSLLYNQTRDNPFEGAQWTITLETDASGRLSGFELTGVLEGEAKTTFFSIAYPDSP